MRTDRGYPQVHCFCCLADASSCVLSLVFLLCHSTQSGLAHFVWAEPNMLHVLWQIIFAGGCCCLSDTADCGGLSVQALSLLSTAFAQSNPSLKQQAVLQLLQHSVALGRTHGVAAQAVKTLQAYDDELFRGRFNTNTRLSAVRILVELCLSRVTHSVSGTPVSETGGSEVLPGLSETRVTGGRLCPTYACTALPAQAPFLLFGCTQGQPLVADFVSCLPLGSSTDDLCMKRVVALLQCLSVSMAWGHQFVPWLPIAEQMTSFVLSG